MAEPADGGVKSSVDVTVDDVSQEVLDRTQERLNALADDPKVKGDIGEKKVLASVVSAVDSTVSAVDSVASVADSTVSAAVAADSVVSAAVSSASVDYSLQDNLYRAAIHEGWTDDDIKDFLEQNPDRARATFKKMYESTTGLSQKWADAGRAKLLADDGTQQQQQQTDTTQAKTDKPKVEFQEIDIEKLRKDYDNDPVVELVAEQQKQNKILFDKVNDLNEAISTRPQAQQQQQQVVDPAAAALAAQVDSFFKQDDMKMYDSFYGTGDNLTPGDIANRSAMFTLADQIRAGRALQGLDTTVDEALAQAHLLVTEPVRERMVRKDIVSKLTKRSNSLSLRPASSGRDVDVAEHDKPKNDAERIANAEQRLAKIKW